MEIKVHHSQFELAEAFCQWLSLEINKKKGVFHLALSGGSTPALIYRMLGEKYINKIDWQKVSFYWSDERCVPPEHEESNYKMAHELFLSLISRANICRIKGENEPEVEVLRYSALIENNLSGEPFDLIMLGLGEDGHTASIFPGQKHLWDNVNKCVIAKNPYSGQYRISLTGTTINLAQNIAVICSGANKAEKIKTIIERTENANSLPGAWIKPQKGSLIWYLDKEAAQLLFIP